MDTCYWLVIATFCILDSMQGDLRRNLVVRQCSVNETSGRIVADCSHRNLESIPSDLPNKTCTLLAQNNRIQSLSPEELHMYPSLRSLNLSCNEISQIHGDAFSGVGDLVSLYLDNNNLSFPNVPSGLFKPLRKLKVLTLYKNRLKDYEDQVLRDLSSLQDLQLDGFADQVFGPGYRNLTNLRNLSLSEGRCCLQIISNDTFEHIGHLSMLNISSCDIRQVHAGAFEPFNRIKVLDISRNRNLGLESLPNITFGLNASTISILYLNEITNSKTTCAIIKPEDIQNLQHTNLTEIHANSNRLSGFDPKTLRLLPQSLRKVYLSDNRFDEGPYVNDLDELTGLEELFLNGKSEKYNLIFGSLLRTLQESKGTALTSQETLTGAVRLQCAHLAWSDGATPAGALRTLESGIQCFSTSDVIKLKVPPNLKRVIYTYSELAFVISEIHFSNNSLESINISSNVLTVWHGPVYGLENLTHLYLSNNIAHSVSSVFFSQMASLIHLDISSNFLGHCIENDTNGEIFGNLSSLTHLDLSSNMIRQLPKKIFKGLNSLRWLDVSQNQIFNLTFVFSLTEQLTMLNVEKNQIQWPMADELSQLDKISQNHTVKLGLASNPFVCSCDLIPFLHWLDQTSVVVIDHSNYTCVYTDQKQFYLNDDTLINELDRACNPVAQNFGLAVGTLTGSVFVLTVIFGAVAYRYRWKISYFYYAASLHLKSRKRETLEYEFDAFVSYAQEDSSFVIEKLVPMLENEKGLKLLIHDRDFTPGKPIAENIVDAVQRSRKTILLISKDFLHSSWCMYELQMANMEQISSERDVMLIVLLEEMPLRDIPREIMYHMHTQTYLEYPHNGQTDTFWITLSLSLTA